MHTQKPSSQSNLAIGNERMAYARYREPLIGGANKAYREALVPDYAVGGDITLEEEHVARVVDIAVRGRPVAAVAAHTAGRSPIAGACGRQEDRSGILQGQPLRVSDYIAAETSSIIVGAAQTISACAPVVGQQDYAVHACHLGLGITDARGSVPIEQDITPFAIGQGAPLACRIAAVADGVIPSPI